MVEGKVGIFLSYKEPEYRNNILWLRPYLDREGYELLYYGVNGWTRLVPHLPVPSLEDKLSGLTKNSVKSEVEYDAPLTSIGPSPTGDIEGDLYEITSVIGVPEKKPSCGCPK